MALPTLEELESRLEAAVPGCTVDLLPNPAAGDQSSLLIDTSHAIQIGRWLRDDPELRFDYCSNVTGIDWPDRVEKLKRKVSEVVDGEEKKVEETYEQVTPGNLEVVYHLYSMALKHGPVIIRQRTIDRKRQCRVTSLTPVWRGCEFQEREVFDLFGVVFTGHPDLRRILMWDEFKDHPMRKDYVEPDDYEYEPTPHGAVLDRAKVLFPQETEAGQ